MGTTGKILCEKNLTRREVAKFRDAVVNGAMYEMYYDNIQLSDHVGGDNSHIKAWSFWDYVYSRRRFYLINHLRFYPEYVGNKVQNIHVTGDLDSAVDITEDAEIKVNFTYSVFWKEIESEENGGWPRPDDLSTKPMPMPYTTAIGICGWLGLLCAVIVPYLRKYFTEYYSISPLIPYVVWFQVGHCNDKYSANDDHQLLLQEFFWRCNRSYRGYSSTSYSW